MVWRVAFCVCVCVRWQSVRHSLGGYNEKRMPSYCDRVLWKSMPGEYRTRSRSSIHDAENRYLDDSIQWKKARPVLLTEATPCALLSSRSLYVVKMAWVGLTCLPVVSSGEQGGAVALCRLPRIPDQRPQGRGC